MFIRITCTGCCFIPCTIKQKVNSNFKSDSRHFEENSMISRCTIYISVVFLFNEECSTKKWLLYVSILLKFIFSIILETRNKLFLKNIQVQWDFIIFTVSVVNLNSLRFVCLYVSFYYYFLFYFILFIFRFYFAIIIMNYLFIV